MAICAAEKSGGMEIIMARRKFELPAQQKGTLIDAQTGKPVEKPAIPVICERIRFYRESRGIEQKVLAKTLGFKSPNSISNWENGRARPDISLLPKICEALGITLYELFDLDDPTVTYTDRQKNLISGYDGLNGGHQFAVDRLIESLRQVEDAESCPDIRCLTYHERRLAAGIGDPTEFEDQGEPLYVYPSPEINKADCVFSVNGNSMEPDYRNGDMVLIKRIYHGGELNCGDIGAFIIGNETYIKEYRKDGLYSLNPEYAPMHFNEETNVYLIGRVIGVLDPKSIATSADVERYEAVYGKQE